MAILASIDAYQHFSGFIISLRGKSGIILQLDTSTTTKSCLVPLRKEQEPPLSITLATQ